MRSKFFKILLIFSLILVCPLAAVGGLQDTAVTVFAAEEFSLKAVETSKTVTNLQKPFKFETVLKGKATITYKSSNTAVAKISKDGTVTITGPGTVTLSATAKPRVCERERQKWYLQ